MKKTKRLHWIALILLFMVAVFRLPAQSPWDGLQRLAGTWKQSGTFLYEKWEAGTTDTLRGEAYQQLPGAEKSTTEYLRIVRQADGSIVYQATVLNQNDSATIEFPLTFFTGNSWAFENPKHDFPQRIEYWLQDGETLRATISGSEDQPIAYWYNKVPDAQAKGPVSLRGYEVFISSRNTGTVKRFNAFTGQYLDEFGKEQIGNETQEVALGPDGKLYVTSLQAKHILKFDPATGAFLGNFTSGYDLQRPTKLSFAGDGFVYVSQWGETQKSVVRFDARTGQFDRDFTGPLDGPLGHARDAEGNLYVACFFSKEIRKFRADGTPLGAVTSVGDLKGPANLWFGAGGDLFVADWEGGAIRRFRPEGNSLRLLGDFASGFARLEGATLGPDGYLYACDWYMNLVKKLDAASGSAIGVYLENGDMARPNGLVFWKRE